MAGPTGEAVVPGAPGGGVVPGPAGQGVGTGTAVEQVVAALAEQPVLATAPGQGVVPVPAVGDTRDGRVVVEQVVAPGPVEPDGGNRRAVRVAPRGRLHVGVRPIDRGHLAEGHDDGRPLPGPGRLDRRDLGPVRAAGPVDAQRPGGRVIPDDVGRHQERGRDDGRDGPVFEGPDGQPGAFRGGGPGAEEASEGTHRVLRFGVVREPMVSFPHSPIPTPASGGHESAGKFAPDLSRFCCPVRAAGGDIIAPQAAPAGMRA